MFSKESVFENIILSLELGDILQNNKYKIRLDSFALNKTLSLFDKGNGRKILRCN